MEGRVEGVEARVLDNHVTKEQFLLEFFGSFGRDLGNPERWFTDNPTDVFPFIEECAENKLPAFMSVQPDPGETKSDHDTGAFTIADKDKTLGGLVGINNNIFKRVLS